MNQKQHKPKTAQTKKGRNQKGARTKKWLLVENCIISTKIQFVCFWELRLNKFDWNVIVNIFSVPEKESLT